MLATPFRDALRCILDLAARRKGFFQLALATDIGDSLTQLITRFGDRIDLESAEKCLDQFSALDLPHQNFHFDFSQSQHADIGAGYRIGNLLRRLSKVGHLSVSVPAGKYEANSIPASFFLAFTRSGLGPAISRYASEVSAGKQSVKDALASYYCRTLEIPGQNSIYVPDIHTGVIDVDDEPRFGRLLGNLLGKVNLQIAGLDRMVLQDVIALCFEAVQNVYDHAAKKPLLEERVFSYLSLRYYKRSGRVTGGGPLAAYQKRVDQEKHLASGYCLEILVNDDGNGIAARQTLNSNVYWGPLDAEQEALAAALTKSSIKLTARDSKIRGGVAGEGFSRIRGVLKQLKAFASLRTGRWDATFDGTVIHETSFRLNRGQFGLQLGLMPGTALQVLIPIPGDEKQGRLFET